MKKNTKHNNILIIGATSAIAQATARLFAERGDRLYLLARDASRLQVMTEDLKIRGAAGVDYATVDATDTVAQAAALEAAFAALGTVDVVLLAYGTLPEQRACEQNLELAAQAIQVNAVSVILSLTQIANALERQGHGHIVVITSVAGDRGRQSNYVYGAAKRMVSTFLQGLRNRLYKANVQVLDVKPGFVDTPMTKDFAKGLLWVKPEVVAKDIVKGIAKQKHQLYTPFFWRYIMLIIRMVPERLFKRLTL